MEALSSKIDIDLLASAWNAQVPTLVYREPQPGAFALDAFALNWKSRAGYAFPLFSLIPRCLSKIMALIAPILPSQPWYPLLFDLAV